VRHRTPCGARAHHRLLGLAPHIGKRLFWGAGVITSAGLPGEGGGLTVPSLKPPFVNPQPRRTFSWGTWPPRHPRPNDFLAPHFPYIFRPQDSGGENTGSFGENAPAPKCAHSNINRCKPASSRSPPHIGTGRLTHPRGLTLMRHGRVFTTS